MSDRALRNDVTQVDGRDLDPHDGAAERRRSPDASPPRQTLGRYRLIERLGAGGMGVVYRAHDPELARDVAIKLLHPHTARSEAARARLRQEARALAEVSHPNVVQVYDVGEDGDSIYISMELVPGVDLREWLEARADRPWRDVLALLLAAGRGLRAAHHRGLVHRDFKPSNVLVGDDGRARVVDFGLACLADDVHTAPEASAASGPRSGSLTESGVALGTPAYMAPQQHRGLGADARSDQYAFCMSVWEGLYGERPFTGTSLQALVAAKEQGLPRRPPASRGVPKRVHAALLQGLRPLHTERWPDMAALLAALERGARPRRVRPWVAAAAVVAVGSAGAAAHALGRDQAPGLAACPPASERLAGVWDEAREHELQRAIEASGLAYAGPTWSRARTHLHDYAAQWAESYDRTCAARGAGAQGADDQADAAALDRRMLCLADRRDELASVVDVLLDGRAPAVRSAVQAAAGLRPVSSCDDPEGLGPDDGTRHAEVDALRRDLLRAESLGKVARYDEGLALAQAAIERATAAELPALRAEALLVAGQMYKGKAAPEDAQRLLSEAALLAVSIDRAPIAARAAIELVDVQGAWRSRYDEALEWNRHAQAAIERLGGDLVLEARRLTALGYLELTLGHTSEALDAFERSLALVRQAFGEGHPRLAAARSDLGNALVRAGRFDEALAATREALAAGEQAFGEGHPEVGIMHDRVATAWVRKGDYDAAAEHAHRAIEILEAALGPEHPNVGAIVVNLGQIEQRRGRLPQAEAAYRRALSGLAGSINEAIVLGALCDLAREQGDDDAALAYARRSRELREALHGPDGSMVAMGLLAEGLALSRVGRDEEAFVALERARRIDAAKPLNPLHRTIMDAYEGRAHLSAGRHAQAIEKLEHALAEQEQLGVEPIDRADVRFHLVQALWAVGRKHEARALLAAVDADLAPLGPRADHRRRPIHAWIDREAVDYAMHDRVTPR